MSLEANTYAKSLSYLCHGHPLWIPEPCGGHEVMIGDVGYILDGGFYRLFNVTLPRDHEVNYRGVPQNFEVLPLDTSDTGLHRVEALIPPQSVLCSRKVRQTEVIGDVVVGAGPAEAGIAYRFTCSEEQGAVLVLKDHATSKRVHPSDKRFANYMQKHWREWHNFVFETVALEPEEMVFVSGHVKTTQWAIAAFLTTGSAHELSFQAGTGSFSRARFSVATSTEHSSSVRHRIWPIANEEPQTEPGPQNQCIFLSYFKLKRSRFLKSRFKIVAAAEPKYDGPPSPVEPEEYCTSGARSVSDGEYSIEARPSFKPPWDPLDSVLDYILEATFLPYIDSSTMLM